jgi:hypothetical protein
MSVVAVCPVEVTVLGRDHPQCVPFFSSLGTPRCLIEHHRVEGKVGVDDAALAPSCLIE